MIISRKMQKNDNGVHWISAGTHCYRFKAKTGVQYVEQFVTRLYYRILAQVRSLSTQYPQTTWRLAHLAIFRKRQLLHDWEYLQLKSASEVKLGVGYGGRMRKRWATLDADWYILCQHSRLSQSNNYHNWKQYPWMAGWGNRSETAMWKLWRGVEVESKD